MRTRFLAAALLALSACSPSGQADKDVGKHLVADTITQKQDTRVGGIDGEATDAAVRDVEDTSPERAQDVLAKDTKATGEDSGAAMDTAISLSADGHADAMGSADGGPDIGAADVYIYPQATPGSAPAVSVHPWPPPCAKPKFITKYTNAYDCWDLPEHWCAHTGGARSAIYPFCSPDGTQCCIFTGGCYPCGWVNCFGECSFGDPDIPDTPKCPPQCKHQVSPWAGGKAMEALWGSPACVLLNKVLSPPELGGGKVDSCAICGTEVYCKWKKS